MNVVRCPEVLMNLVCCPEVFINIPIAHNYYMSVVTTNHFNQKIIQAYCKTHEGQAQCSEKPTLSILRRPYHPHTHISTSIIPTVLMESGWTLVTSKKHRPRHNANPKTPLQASTTPLDTQNQSHLQTIITTSPILSQLTTLINARIQASPHLPLKLYILGLGNFVDFKKPRLQYLLIKHVLQSLDKVKVAVNAYDPVFDEGCVRGMEELGHCTFDPLWECCLEDDEMKVFYMVHCEKQLYEQVLSRTSKNIIIVGNSLAEYNQRATLTNKPTSILFREANLREHKLTDLEESFNDTYFLTD